MSKAYRFNYVALTVNVLMLARYALPPFRWIDLIGIVHVAAIGVLIISIRSSRRLVHNQEQRELDRSMNLLQSLWVEDYDDERPATWFLTDTHQ